MLLARAARTLAARVTSSVASPVIAATTAVAVATAGLTAVATPATATGFDPTDWRTLPYTDLLEQSGWGYLSMVDHRWKYDRMQTNDTPIWQCSCTPAAFANVLDWQFSLDGGPAETVPRALTPIHSWWDQTGPPVGAELLWSPTYVDAYLAKTSGYQDRGIGDKACGTYAYPWSLAEVGAAQAVEVSGTTVSAPSGITWTVHDTRASGLTDEVRNAIARELAAGRLVVAMRAAPAGPDENGDMTYGGHGNLITGFDPNSERLLAVDHGWKKGSSSQQGALRGKYDETYAEWEDSILEVFVYRTTTTTPTYTSLTGAPAGGSRTTTAPADYRLSVVRPDGARIGHDPSTGASSVVDGSYVHGGVLPDAQAGDGDGVVDHLPDAAYLREPQAGRWRYTVHGVTDGGYDLLLQDHVDGATVERGRLTGTVQAGSQRKVEAVRAGDGTTLVSEVEQFRPEPVVVAPATAASGGQVVLDGSRSFDADGSVASWSWDVGDGTVLDGRRVGHAFDAGTHRVTLTVTDDAGATTSTEHVLVVSPSDVHPPRLEVEPSGGGDWQRAPFAVTVSATDAGRGVRRLTARADGASPAAERSGDGADLVVPVAVVGSSGRLGDTGNLVQAAAWQDGGFMRADDTDLDTTAPTASATPDDGTWSRQPVVLTVTAADADSGVASVTASEAGDVAGDRAEVPVAREGTTTVAYAATDVAGNAAPVRTATVRIDRTAPEVRRAAGPQGWSREPVVLPVSASDALSGLATLHYRVDDGPEVVVPDGGAGVEVSADGVHTCGPHRPPRRSVGSGRGGRDGDQRGPDRDARRAGRGAPRRAGAGPGHARRRRDR